MKTEMKNKMYDLEILFICFQHTIKPREQLLGAMVGVKHNWNIIVLRHHPHVLSSGNRTEDRRFFVSVLDPFTSQECCPSV